MFVSNVSNTVLSEKKTFTLNNTCSAGPLHFHFHNLLGGMDTFTFYGSRATRQNIKRQTWEKQLPEVPTVKDRGVTTLANVETLEFTAFSDFLNKAEALWVRELFSSIQIYVEDGTDLVSVTSISRPQIVVSSEDLVQYEFRYQGSILKTLPTT